MPEDLGSFGAAIGELRSDAKRNYEAVNSLTVELRRLGDKLDSVATLSTSFAEYRKTLHDRFDRINEIANGTTLALDKLEDRVAMVENDKMISIDKRITSLEGTWKTQLKLIGAIGSIVLTVGGWIVGTYGSVILHALGGGG